jgi:hypothetical protein
MGCHKFDGVQALEFVRTFTRSPTRTSSALYELLQVALALRNPQTGTVTVADANYLTVNAGDALLWNRSQALELFTALQNDKPVPASR